MKVNTTIKKGLKTMKFFSDTENTTIEFYNDCFVLCNVDKIQNISSKAYYNCDGRKFHSYTRTDNRFNIHRKITDLSTNDIELLKKYKNVTFINENKYIVFKLGFRKALANLFIKKHRIYNDVIKEKINKLCESQPVTFDDILTAGLDKLLGE